MAVQATPSSYVSQTRNVNTFQWLGPSRARNQQKQVGKKRAVKRVFLLENVMIFYKSFTLIFI
jgi:hypothetical protein